MLLGPHILRTFITYFLNAGSDFVYLEIFDWFVCKKICWYLITSTKAMPCLALLITVSRSTRPCRTHNRIAAKRLHFIHWIFTEHVFSHRVISSTSICDDITSPGQQFDFTFSALQIYSAYYHNYSPNSAWDLVLYIGDVKLRRDYLQVGHCDWQYDSIEAKLRTSWEYPSLEGKGTIIIHFGFNLDNLRDDPWDGGGISYQVVI